MASSFIAIRVSGSDMRCFVAGDDSARPGVLVCMHGPGLDEFIQEQCRRLDEAGFVAVAPDVYHRQEAPGLSPRERAAMLEDDEILVDFAASTEHLHAHSDPDRQLVVGFCMGGRLSYLWAAHSDVNAAAVFYGGNIMQSWGGGPTPFDRSAEIECPLRGFFGNDDANPSPADVDRIESRLRELGKDFSFHRYDGAGHAFLHPERPTFRPRAAADAWSKCIEFLRGQS